MAGRPSTSITRSEPNRRSLESTRTAHSSTNNCANYRSRINGGCARRAEAGSLLKTILKVFSQCLLLFKWWLMRAGGPNRYWLESWRVRDWIGRRRKMLYYIQAVIVARGGPRILYTMSLFCYLVPIWNIICRRLQEIFNPAPKKIIWQLENDRHKSSQKTRENDRCNSSKKKTTWQLENVRHNSSKHNSSKRGPKWPFTSAPKRQPDRLKMTVTAGGRDLTGTGLPRRVLSTE